MEFMFHSGSTLNPSSMTTPVGLPNEGNHVTFLTMGSSHTNKSLIFSLEKVERKEKDRRGKEVNVIRHNLVVKYV